MRTADHTQWRWIYIDRAIGERVYVKKKLDDDGKYRDFRVPIQEPVTRDLLLAEEAVRTKWDSQQPAEIVGLEVSVDFTPRKPSDEARALMFGVLVRSYLPSRNVIDKPLDRPRFAWDDGDDATAYVLGHNKRHPDRSNTFLLDPGKDQPATIDSTYYVGARGTRSSWRTMIKLLDKQNIATGTREALPEKKKGVRIEVTITESDYAAHADTYGDIVGRIYRHDSGEQAGKWFWSMTAFGPEISRNVGNLTGFEPSPHTAARMVEDGWFAAINGSSLDRPPPKRNAYEMANVGE